MDPEPSTTTLTTLFSIHQRSERADPRRLADEELMALVRDGDARAFEVIFDRHVDAAFSLAYRICGARGRAEDAVQESFLSLWRSGARYDPSRGSVRAWVLGVVRNRSIDMLRRYSVRDARNVDNEEIIERLPSGELIEVEAERREEARLVRSALGDLPGDQKQVIELAYFGGFTHSEIAEMLELPPGTVKGRMRLGLSKLRLSLAGTGAVP